MSKLTLVATVLSLAAGALGGAAYQKAALVQAELRGLHAPRGDAVEGGASAEALEREVHRLATRVAILELQARSAATPPSEAPEPADSAAPSEKEGRSHSPYDLGPLPKDDDQRQARKQMVSAAVTTHWKVWGAKHGLTERQVADLSSLQSDAAKRRLDNQARLADGQITQPETRASNQAVSDEVRSKAKAILTAEQLAQFEADKGAEWGSSYRKIREVEAKEAAPTGGGRN